MMRPEPAFAEPWHAQLFALTVHLSDQGHFTWSHWADAFGATLKRHGVARDLDGGDDYFTAWLETLETVLEQAGAADAVQIAQLKEAWKAAYLATPHGAPVTLRD